VNAERHRAPKTFWNHRATPCHRVVVRVGRSRSPETAWTQDRGLLGTERAAVQVWPEGLVHDPIYLDDLDGSAWHLVTYEHGDLAAPHRFLDVDKVLEDLTEY
jgi:hypothetical protein